MSLWREYFCFNFSFVLYDLIAWYLMVRNICAYIVFLFLFSNFKAIQSFLPRPWFNGHSPDHSIFNQLLFHLRHNCLISPVFENEFLVTIWFWEVMVYLANIGMSNGLFPPDKWLRADRGQMHIQEYPLHNVLQQSLSPHSHTHS